jgi:hypothetical protein
VNVEHVLKIPSGEIAFLYPNDASADRIDKRFTRIRVDRRGLRKWDTFEEKPDIIESLMKLPTGLPENWVPCIDPWDRYLGSELNMVDSLSRHSSNA